MDGIYGDVKDFLTKPSLIETLVDILLCAVPIWLAVMIGLVIGWSWRPRFTGLLFLGLRSKFRFLCTAPPGFGARRLWFAFTALSAFSLGRRLWSNFKGKGEESAGLAAAVTALTVASSEDSIHAGERSGVVHSHFDSSKREGEDEAIAEKDLEHLLHLSEGKAEDMTWQFMLERSTPNMAYEAWRHDHEAGPTIYRSRTVYEDATPELVRDFFWDDEFRANWDSMLFYSKTLEECPQTGTMIVHWIKKFPFFCSDREYIFGRRIWDSGKAYFCVTKSVPYPGIPKRDKPRRVELYFSSWIIRPAESRKRNGQFSACEVILVHYEDMGIPKDIANLGVRHGMWGTVKKVHSGLRSYQLARKSEAPLSRSALMARISTKVPINGSTSSSERQFEEALENENSCGAREDLLLKAVDHGVDWRWIIVGGTVAVVCGLNAGIIGKCLLLGVGAARRLARK